jgi:hypothetical protein
MTRRLEAGPLLVTLGALLLLVSLFLSWFTGEITAWEGFEVWDVVLFVLALGAIAGGLGLTTQDAEMIDRRFLPGAVVAVAVVVASQIIDPPPAAAGQDPDTGAWLALGAALVMWAGAVLTFGRVHLALTVEGREPQRRRVAAVDARGPADPTTDNIPAVRPPEREGGRLFARHRDTEPDPEAVTAGAAAPEQGAAPSSGSKGKPRRTRTRADPPTSEQDVAAAGIEPPEQKQD